MSKITIEPEAGELSYGLEYHEMGDTPFVDSSGTMFVKCGDMWISVTYQNGPFSYSHAEMKKLNGRYRPYHGKITIEFGEGV